MAFAAIGNFAKSILPGLKNIGTLAGKGFRSAVGAFKGAKDLGVGARLYKTARIGKGAIMEGWRAMGPAAQSATRNAAATLAVGGGAYALRSGR